MLRARHVHERNQLERAGRREGPLGENEASVDFGKIDRRPDTAEETSKSGGVTTESTLIAGAVLIATAAAAVKFALFECERFVRAWRRVARPR